jgi:hypothetical protein
LVVSSGHDMISKAYIEISRGVGMAKTQQPKFSKVEFKGRVKDCPRCSVKAKGLAEIEEVFGLRNSGGHVIAQSLCRLCRSSHAREVRAFKAENKKLVGKDLRSHTTGKGKKATLVRASVGKKLSHKVKTKVKKIKATKKTKVNHALESQKNANKIAKRLAKINKLKKSKKKN